MPVSGRERGISCGEPRSARSSHIVTVSKYPCGDGLKGVLMDMGNLCSLAMTGKVEDLSLAASTVSKYPSDDGLERALLVTGNLCPR